MSFDAPCEEGLSFVCLDATVTATSAAMRPVAKVALLLQHLRLPFHSIFASNSDVSSGLSFLCDVAVLRLSLDY